MFFKKKIRKGVSAVAAVSVLLGTAMNAVADNSNNISTESWNGITYVTGIKSSDVINGVLTVPDELGDKIFLGDPHGTRTFLGDENVETLVIGDNVWGVTTSAFTYADSLRTIIVPESNTSFISADEGLYGYISEGDYSLVKYYAGNPKQDFTMPDYTSTVINADNAEFATLDLNNVSTIYPLTFAGTKIDKLVLSNDVLNASAEVAEGSDILYGAEVDSFEAVGAFETNGDGSVLSKGGRIIKFATSADTLSEDDLAGFTSISPFAFTSMAQYENIIDKLPEGIADDVVFSFYNQGEAVFKVNGQIGFCFNYDRWMPGKLGKESNFDIPMTGLSNEALRKAKNLMYYGVPNDSTGIFESVFGTDYDSVKDTFTEGDAALNVVSSILYRITTNGQYEPSEIKGIDGGIFTEARIQAYKNALLNAIETDSENRVDVEFTTDDEIVFEKQTDGTYLSSETVVNASNGDEYELKITSDGVTVNGNDTFLSGSKVRFSCESIPEKISFTTDCIKLGFYLSDIRHQNVLTTKVTEKQYTLNATEKDEEEKLVEISKQDITTGKELKGAELTVFDSDGEVVDTWVSGSEPHMIKDMADGTYTLREITSPDGYEVAEDIEFEVTDGTTSEKIIMYDTPVAEEIASASEIRVRKTDSETGKDIAGAELTIYDEDGMEVETWTTTGKAHVITDLEEGMYILREVEVPEGYEYADDIEFEVYDGLTLTIVMKDAPVEKPEETETEKETETTPEVIETTEEDRPEPETTTIEETVPETSETTVEETTAPETSPAEEPTSSTTETTKEEKETEKSEKPKTNGSYSGGDGGSYVAGRGLQFNQRTENVETPETPETAENAPVPADIPETTMDLVERSTPKTGERVNTSLLLCSSMLLTAIYFFGFSKSRE